MIRVGLYCRVSTDEQALHGGSLKTQKDELKKYAIQHNYEIVDTYVDDGYTATNVNRPQLQRLLKDIKQNKIDLILITKLDRLIRSVKDYYKIFRIIKNHNVTWKSIFDYHNNPLEFHIALALAENESRMISDRINAVFLHKLENKQITTGSHRYGYDICGKKLIINEQEKKIVNEIYDIFIREKSFRKTTLLIKPKANLSIKAVTRILKSKLYIGIYEHTKKNIFIPDYCPKIININKFKKVQNIIDSKKDSLNSTKKIYDYIFDNILLCSHCGCRFSAATRKNKYSNRAYYYCKKHESLGNCQNKIHINEEIIEKNLLLFLKEIICEYKINKEQKTHINSKKSNVYTYLNKLNNKLATLRKLEQDNLIDYDSYLEQYENIQESILKEKERLNELELEEEKKSYVNTIKRMINTSFMETYNKLSILKKRDLWHRLFKAISINNKGKIVSVTFKNDITLCNE